MFVTAVAVALLVTTGGILLATGGFNVQRVTVVGASRSTTDRVSTLAKSDRGHLLLTVNTSTLRHRIAALSQVADVQVTRVWPHTLRIEVTERRPIVAVHDGAQWLLVDKNADAYLSVARPPASVLPLSVPGSSSDGQRLRAAVAVVGALPRAVRKDVIAVSAPSPAGIRLQLRGGSTVIWGGPDDSVRKAKALAVLVRRHAHVYDVSSPGIVTTS
ncbi:MAG: cell division protein FtsQ/DivIB [Actinomycetes bacterium]